MIFFDILITYLTLGDNVELYEKYQRDRDIQEVYNRVIRSNPEPFSEYSYFYWETSESLLELFVKLDLSMYQNALSVLSSGDHVFNIIHQGIKKVDTFDSNRITQYFVLEFKKAAIQCLTFEQYRQFFSMPAECISLPNKYFEYQDFILSNTEPKYQKFWKEMMYLYKEEHNKELALRSLAQAGVSRSNLFDATQKKL